MVQSRSIGSKLFRRTANQRGSPRHRVRLRPRRIGRGASAAGALSLFLPKGGTRVRGRRKRRTMSFCVLVRWGPIPLYEDINTYSYILYAFSNFGYLSTIHDEQRQLESIITRVAYWS